MTPLKLDPDVVTIRLRLIQDGLDQLEELRAADSARLSAEPLTKAAVERFIQAIVDLAIDVNSHVAAALLGEAPRTGRASFDFARRACAIENLAERLAPAAGMRNILVHRYTDIEVDKVAEAIVPVLDGFGEYVRQVARFVRSYPDG